LAGVRTPRPVGMSSFVGDSMGYTVSYEFNGGLRILFARRHLHSETALCRLLDSARHLVWKRSASSFSFSSSLLMFRYLQVVSIAPNECQSPDPDSRDVATHSPIEHDRRLVRKTLQPQGNAESTINQGIKDGKRASN
jgi:hypothetical protein